MSECDQETNQPARLNSGMEVTGSGQKIAGSKASKVRASANGLISSNDTHLDKS